MELFRLALIAKENLQIDSLKKALMEAIIIPKPEGPLVLEKEHTKKTRVIRKKHAMQFCEIAETRELQKRKESSVV